jgi:DNA mismatch endonuclease (patch repair protein)
VPSEPLPPPPAASSETVRRLLSTTRRTGTANELALRGALDALGIAYEVDAVPLATQRRRRADLVIRPSRIAVFSDGCFWHRCPQHFHLPKANAEWWELKLRDDRRRDRDTDFRLRVAGWLPLRCWEHVDPQVAGRRIAQEVAPPYASAWHGVTRRPCSRR